MTYCRRQTRLRAGAVFLLAFTLLAASGGLMSQSAEARGARVPSQAQLGRLASIEHYIQYFTGQEYGDYGDKVSADFIRALILTESSAFARARSHKGARGLTQIMPTTGRLAVQEILRLNREFEFVPREKLERFRVEYLYDPAINILIACHMNAAYHREYGGRVELVASAWNAGPGAVAKYGNRPPPYRETRGHIATLRGYLAYFGDGAVVPALWTPGNRLPSRVSSSAASAFNSPEWQADWNDPAWKGSMSPPGWEDVEF